MKSLVVILAALTLVSCSRDPNVAKKRYLENGNRYFARGKFKEASIMYRNALQKDQRYGPAYYRLALTDLKLGRIPNALGELRRASGPAPVLQDPLWAPFARPEFPWANPKPNDEANPIRSFVFNKSPRWVCASLR